MALRTAPITEAELCNTLQRPSNSLYISLSRSLCSNESIKPTKESSLEPVRPDNDISVGFGTNVDDDNNNTSSNNSNNNNNDSLLSLHRPPPNLNQISPTHRLGRS